MIDALRANHNDISRACMHIAARPAGGAVTHPHARSRSSTRWRPGHARMGASAAPLAGDAVTHGGTVAHAAAAAYF